MKALAVASLLGLLFSCTSPSVSEEPDPMVRELQEVLGRGLARRIVYRDHDRIGLVISERTRFESLPQKHADQIARLVLAQLDDTPKKIAACDDILRTKLTLGTRIAGRLLSDENARVRIKAIQVLMAVGDSSYMRVVGPLANDPNEWVRQAARQAQVHWQDQ